MLRLTAAQDAYRRASLGGIATGVGVTKARVGRERLRRWLTHGLLAKAAAGAVALIVTSALVVGTTAALFSDADPVSGNTLSAGTLDLTDDASLSVLFNVSGLTPGDSVVNCVAITYAGTVADPAAVRLYSGGYTDPTNLADHLNITIDEGTGGSFGSCAGFVLLPPSIETGSTLSEFEKTHQDYASGAGNWDPAATPDARTYRFTFTLDSSTPGSFQGATVTGLTFTWEVRSS